jgi:NDP-sugar pyrophosphorylase family protein
MISGFFHNEDKWLDIGKTKTLAEANNLFEKIRNTYQV